MFEGFEVQDVDTGEVTVHLRVGGTGPPLLLLHGAPQTHVMWHAVAPRLAEHFTVVAADLRGYGASSTPGSAPDHEPHSKRAMARDAVAVMAHLGFDAFGVAGHDRGGRVAYRLALDHPERVSRVAVLDVLPTLEHYRRADAAFGSSYWHWFFLAQPFPVPETLIAGDPDYFFFGREWKDRAVPPPFFTDEALAAYRAAALRPAFAHALCEDYRAGATFDVAADEADAGTTRIRCPLLVLWGTRSFLSRLYDPVGVWQDWCDDVHGEPVDSGHYLAEERPEEVLRALRTFFMDGAATC